VKLLFMSSDEEVQNVMNMKEIRRLLTDTKIEYEVTVNAVTMSGKEARQFFYYFRDDKKLYKVIKNKYGKYVDNTLHIYIVD